MRGFSGLKVCDCCTCTCIPFSTATCNHNVSLTVYVLFIIVGPCASTCDNSHSSK